MPRAKTRTTRSSSLQPRVKVWLETDQTYAFGHGLSEILKAVDKAGSIKAAADLLGKSYRHIWSRIKEAEKTLGEPLVTTRVGGTGSRRSELTERARQLVTDYDALRRRMFQVAKEEFASRFAGKVRQRKG